MSRYAMLLNILDRIRSEGASTKYTSKYVAHTTNADQINHERSRAFIHLYLKVSFGILDFEARERIITDGPSDGGIDGYYIDAEHRLVYLIQSKFRTTEENFADKRLTLDELLAMDVTRILDGHQESEDGQKYNGKIVQLQREVSSIEDVGRYKYVVVLLANLGEIPHSKLSRVVGGLPCEVFDYERCYRQLVFPVISGTYFNASELVIHLDLSNKNAGSKISYTVDTRYGECEITALFVPTLEIARTFHRYKNSILKFNPRSYLELEGAKVNEAIRNTVLQKGKNEFALYNNGITMLSDDTGLNEKIGQKNKARLNVTNPQIINGGQTAYTLARIYEELQPEELEKTFEGKEVLLKVITLNSSTGTTEQDKLSLIEAISEATNQQTAVYAADRFSNEEVNVELQRNLFERYGLLFERKRGEFEDGVRNGYLAREQIIERNLFFRILFAANGDINRAVQKRLFMKLSKSGWAIPTPEQLNRFYFAHLCSQQLKPGKGDFESKEAYAKLYVMAAWYTPADIGEYEAAAKQAVPAVNGQWRRFVEVCGSSNARYTKVKIDVATNSPVSIFNKRKWVRSGNFSDQVTEYFEKNPPPGARAPSKTSRV